MSKLLLSLNDRPKQQNPIFHYLSFFWFIFSPHFYALGTISFTDSLKAPMFWVIMQGPVSCKLWRVSGNKNPYDYQFWPWKTWQKIKRLTQEEGVCVSQKKKYQAQTAVVNKTFWKVKKMHQCEFICKISRKTQGSILVKIKLVQCHAKIVSLQSINLQNLGPQQ